MRGGWNGKLLSVDLTKKLVAAESYSDDLVGKYIGGASTGIKIVYDEVLPGMDAFDERIPLVFVTGPLTATAALSSGGYGIVTKSPISNFNMSMATANGFFGLRLKQAGFDFIIVRGKSEKPVYLWVHDGQAELRDATKVWGLDAYETEAKLKGEVGQKNASVSCIGPAGENMVKYACVNSDNGHILSSGGIGSVMGSKKLKGIVAYGTQKIPVVDKEALDKAVEEWRGYIERSPVAQGIKAYGTGASVGVLYEMGDLPVKNLSTNVFPEYENLTGMAIRNNFKTRVKPCYRCPINHVHSVEFTEGKHKGLVIEEPEYEGCAGLGSNIGVGSTEDMLYLNHLVDTLLMDYKTLSFVISLAMECYEKGLVSKEQLNGLDLTWGNADAVEKLIGMISRREGIGDIMAEGPKALAEYIGGEAVSMAVHIRGAGIHLHDIRSLWGYGLSHVICGYSATVEGASAEFGGADDINVPQQNPHTAEGQGLSIRKKAWKEQICDVLMICHYTTGQSGVPMELLVRILNAITGERYTVDDTFKCMDRMRNLARVFSLRHGMTVEDDWPSERLLMPIKDGPLAGLSWKPHLKEMVKDYYREIGWDEETSKPLKKTLEDLDLDDVIKDIWD